MYIMSNIKKHFEGLKIIYSNKTNFAYFLVHVGALNTNIAGSMQGEKIFNKGISQRSHLYL